MYVCSYNEKLCGQYLYNLIHCYEIYYLFEKIITVFKSHITCTLVCLDLIKASTRYFSKNLSLYINKCILTTKSVLFKSSFKKNINWVHH